MSDRELLEDAAKAAGYVLGKHTQKDWAFTYGGKEWNPLTDDGDALRLAVGLDIRVCPVTADGCNAYASHDCLAEGVWEPHKNDPFAATRRAIVRAAAEIGRNMT